MNSIIELLNHWGARFGEFALPMLVQSTLLIVFLLALDLLIRRRVRAVLRYGLWMLLLIKLVLPPSFASPTSLAYWLPQRQPSESRRVMPPQVVVRYSDAPLDEVSVLPAPPLPRPKLRFAAWLFLGWLAVSFTLIAWLGRRSRQIAASVRCAIPAPDSPERLLEACRRQMRIRRRVRLKLSSAVSSPAVYGLLRPVVLVPQALADRLSALQLRAVLLHELAHIKRGDVLVHYAQTLLQIFYWWHPLLWLANAHIRRVREQAVDEMVMLEMGTETEVYPATLLEVAKVAFRRPMLVLGLIGIVESRSALAQRVQRLLDRPVPKSAKLGVRGLVTILVAAAFLLPMARAGRAANQDLDQAQANPKPDAQPPVVNVAIHFVELTDSALNALSLGPPTSTGTNGHLVWVLPPVKGSNLIQRLRKQDGATLLASPGISTRSGQQAQISTAELKDLFGNGMSNSLSCDLLPIAQDDLIELTAISKMLAAGKVVPSSTNASVYSVNAVGYINYDIGSARVLITNGGTAVLQNPSLKDAQGNRILVIITPTLERKSAANSAAAHGTASASTRGLAYSQLTRKVDVQPTPSINSVAQPETDLQFKRGNDKALALDALKGRAPRNEVRPLVSKVESPFATTNLVHTGPGRQEIQNKLHRIVLNEALFDGVPLPQVLQYLSEESAKRDPDKEGINFLINPNVVQGAPQMAIDPTTGQPVTLPPPELVDMNSVIVRINPPLKDVHLDDLLDAITKVANQPIRYSIEDYDVVFSQKPAEAVRLETRVFRLNPERFLDELRKETGGNVSTNAQDSVRHYFERIGVNVLPPNQIYYNDRKGFLMIRATAEEMDVVQKAIDALNGLHLDKSGAEPRSDIPDRDAQGEAERVKPGNSSSALETRTYKLDLYVLRRNLQKLTGSSSIADASAPLSDLVRQFLETRGVGFKAPKTIFLNEQTGALLVRATTDELEIVRRAVFALNTGKDTGDFLGSFPPNMEGSEAESPGKGQNTKLETRTFHLNSAAFLDELRKWNGSSLASGTTDLRAESLRDFLAAAGVSVRPPNQVYFTLGTGMLTIRAPAKEIELAQKAIETLNIAPPQVTIGVRFMEMPTDTARKLGLDLPPPKASTNRWIHVLPAERAEKLFRSAEQQAGVDIVTTPKVTTLSGRRTQIEAIEMRDIPQGHTPPGVQSKNGVARPQIASQIPVGPMLDVTAYVAADGYTVHLTAIPQVTEILDAATAKQFVPTTLDGVLPLPVARTRKMVTSADIYDGQTLVLANPIVSAVIHQLNGRSVTNAIPEDTGKRLLVFVTATLIDPAGNPIHAGRSPPFDPDSTPPQPTK